jgi:hypothetical protein
MLLNSNQLINTGNFQLERWNWFISPKIGLMTSKEHVLFANEIWKCDEFDILSVETFFWSNNHL